jgi:hypothetical protein
MELGAGWPVCLESVRSRAPENVVILQDVGEPPADFAARAARRLAKLETGGRTVRAAMLVAGAGWGDDVFAARYCMAASIARLAPSRAAQDLLLVGTAQLSEDGCEELASLAATLSEHFGARGPAVRLVLEPLASGMYAVSPQARAEAAGARR